VLRERGGEAASGRLRIAARGAVHRETSKHGSPRSAARATRADMYDVRGACLFLGCAPWRPSEEEDEVSRGRSPAWPAKYPTNTHTIVCRRQQRATAPRPRMKDAVRQPGEESAQV